MYTYNYTIYRTIVCAWRIPRAHILYAIVQSIVLPLLSLHVSNDVDDIVSEQIYLWRLSCERKRKLQGDKRYEEFRVKVDHFRNFPLSLYIYIGDSF